MAKKLTLLLIASTSLLLAGCNEIDGTSGPPELIPGVGETCGGIAGLQCRPGVAYCEKAVGSCNTPDAAGVCAETSEVCTEEYDPVCGCNGEDYGNACSAAAAGVNVAYSGVCNPEREPDEPITDDLNTGPGEATN